MTRQATFVHSVLTENINILDQTIFRGEENSLGHDDYLLLMIDLRHVRVHHVDKDKDDAQLREVLSQRPEGPSRGRRRRGGTS
jgi:hypothetical protein